MKPIRANVRVSGRVQGVSFRYFTKRTAEGHGITGWVRNLPDGDVEGVFEGKEPDVRAVVDWCRRGPEGARVDRIEVDWKEATGEFSDFQVRH